MARTEELARLFQQPNSPAQRRYEICRAYFSEGATADQLAEHFQLHVGTVRAIVRDFARDPDVNSFFTAAGPGRKTSRNAWQSTNGPARSAAKGTPWLRSAPLSSKRDSTSANRTSSASFTARA